MRNFTRSFIKRIARGGALAGGIAFLMGGCAVIGDADEGDDLDEDNLVQTAGGTVIMCIKTPNPSPFIDFDFADVMVDGDAVAGLLAEGHTIGTCPAFMCQDS